MEAKASKMPLDLHRGPVAERVAALNARYRHHGATAVLEHALKDADLGRVFAIIGPLAPKGLGLNSIEWNGQQVQLQANGLDANSVQPLSAALEARGLRARLQDGQLTITPKATR